MTKDRSLISFCGVTDYFMLFIYYRIKRIRDKYEAEMREVERSEKQTQVWFP